MSGFMPSGAVEVLDRSASRPEWLRERRRSYGGSDASALAGMNPWRSAIELWLDKTGRLPDEAPTDAQEWGLRLEPAVLAWFAERYSPDVVRVGMWRQPDEPLFHTNPDGIVLEQGQPVAGVEIKTTSWRQAHEWADDQCPDHAELQAQWSMGVTGLRRWWVVGLVDGRGPRVRCIEADDTLTATVRHWATEFHAGFVLPDLAPALGDTAATNAAIRAGFARGDPSRTVVLTDALAAEFAALGVAKRAAEVADAQVRTADSALRLTLGDASEIVDDLDADSPVLLATCRNDGTFGARRFRADEPGLAQEFTRDVPQIDTAALADAKPDLYRAYRARVIRPRVRLATHLTTEE